MSNILDATIAKRYDIIVKQNSTFNIQLILQDDSGIPLDLTGYEFKLSVRQDGCESSCGCSAGDGNFNQVYKQDFIPFYLGSGHLAFEDIVQLAPGTYKYDMIAVLPSNYGQQYILTGTFKVKRSFAKI